MRVAFCETLSAVGWKVISMKRLGTWLGFFPAVVFSPWTSFHFCFLGLGLLHFFCSLTLWPHLKWVDLYWKMEAPFWPLVWDKELRSISELLAETGFFVFWVFFFFLPFRATLGPYESSQARGRIRATAASLYYSHSNLGYEPCQWPTPQFMAMLYPWPTERGQGSNLPPHGY